MNYYNDNDPKVCAWTQELINEGLIAPGKVVCKSITEVTPDELKDYTQCHFFNGISGWAHALDLAGWPRDRQVFTGSCPCQPLSCAGQRKGHADARHLWPAFYRLISECRPATVVGEQVASKDGQEWLCGVRADMEGIGYAFGAARMLAGSVGAPHKRPRFFWVASNTDDDNANRGRGTMQMRWIGCQAQAPVDLRATGFEWSVESRPVALAYGVPNRVALLNGYGNSIVPQVAAIFLRAYLDTINP